MVECSYLRNKIKLLQNEFVNLERSSTTLVASLSKDLEESMKSKAKLELEIEIIRKEQTKKLNGLEQSQILEVLNISVALEKTSKIVSILEKKCKKLELKRPSQMHKCRACKELLDLSQLEGHIKSQEVSKINYCWSNHEAHPRT